MKSTKKKRCEFCRRWFLPDYRTSEKQFCCTSRLCRKLRRLKTYRKWQSHNPDYDDYRRGKIRKWAKNFPSYWKNWRKDHPDYKRREKKRVSYMPENQNKPDPLKNDAKQITSPSFLVENFNNTLRNMTKILAKQSEIIRRTNSLFQTFVGNFPKIPSQNKSL